MNAGTRLGPSARLDQGIRALKLELPADAAGQMLAYLAELHKWNAAYNLTAVRDPEEMVTRHLLDSLVVLPKIRDPGPGTGDPGKQMRVVDVGSGAGLPGIPLAIADAALQVTLVDSNGKKARFLRHVKRALTLNNVEVVEARAEEFHPGQLFDRVISRAFGSLAEFLSCTSHLCGAGGQWQAMKGKLDETELSRIPSGFSAVNVQPLTVPGLDETRHLIVFARVPGPEASGASAGRLDSSNGPAGSRVPSA